MVKQEKEIMRDFFDKCSVAKALKTDARNLLKENFSNIEITITMDEFVSRLYSALEELIPAEWYSGQKFEATKALQIITDKLTSAFF